MPIRNAPYRKPAKRRRSVSSVSKTGDLQTEITGQRRQGERQHEAVVESIREHAEHDRRDQQVRVPAVKDGESRFDERQRCRQHQAGEIEDVVERQRRRFDFVVRSTRALREKQ